MKAKTASERAAEVGDRPDVKAWIAKFQKLASTMPKDVWVFVASGTPCVVANDADGNPIERGSRSDQDALIATIYGGQWDGGDW